jgi:hypothetical protein
MADDDDHDITMKQLESLSLRLLKVQNDIEASSSQSVSLTKMLYNIAL